MSSSQASLFEGTVSELDLEIQKCTNMLKSCAVGTFMRSQGAVVYRSEVGFDYTSGKYRMYAKFEKRIHRALIILDGKCGWTFRLDDGGLQYSETDGERDSFPPEFFFPSECLNSVDVFNYEMKHDVFIPFDKNIFFDLLDFGKWFHAK